MNEYQSNLIVSLSSFFSDDSKGATLARRVTWLARHADISPPTARDWLAGKPKVVSLEVLDKVALALECEPGDLFGREASQVAA